MNIRLLHSYLVQYKKQLVLLPDPKSFQDANKKMLDQIIDSIECSYYTSLTYDSVMEGIKLFIETEMDENKQDNNLSDNDMYTTHTPFSLADKSKFLSKVIMNKSTNAFYAIIGCALLGVDISNRFITYKELLEDFTFEDGSPCGNQIIE